MKKSEIRKSYIFNKYSIITPGRAKRPREILEQSIEKNASKCVLCPTGIEKNLIIKTYGNIGGTWKMAIIKNKYPSVTLHSPKAYGVQEILIESPDHNCVFSQLPLSDISLYFNVFSDRLREISKNTKIEYILEFKNSGSKAGATIKHSHSQIFATSILPFDVLDELNLSEIYKNEKGSCPYCDILKRELSSPRFIWSDGLIGAFAPFASEYHYETWIFPLRHTDNISTLNKNEVRSLSVCVKLITEKLDNFNIAYNFFLHQVISKRDQHFYIKIQPRDSNIWAGVELGSGLIINSIPPEQAAKFYRK